MLGLHTCDASHSSLQQGCGQGKAKEPQGRRVGQSLGHGACAGAAAGSGWWRGEAASPFPRQWLSCRVLKVKRNAGWSHFAGYDGDFNLRFERLWALLEAREAQVDERRSLKSKNGCSDSVGRCIASGGARPMRSAEQRHA